MRTLQDLLRGAADGPARLACVGGPSWSAAELLDRAQAAAGGAVAAGIRPGDPVLLLVADIPDFFTAFWGVVFAGATPVPLAGPRAASVEELGRVQRVIEQLGGPIVVDRGVTLPGLDLIDVAALLDGEPTRSEPAGPALIQYSSGSTRAPRGVVLEHAMLLANIEQLAARVPLSSDDVMLTWMPHFHDMGLIGCHLLALRLGLTEHRMGAAEAIADPLHWIRTAERIGATALSSTNLALARLNQRLPAGVDLGTVRLLATGAEPLSPSVLREFSRLSGVPESVHYPMYGLAEACVGVAAPRSTGLQTRELAGRELVLIGEPLDGVELRIVDPEDGLGLLELRGPNVFARYFGEEVSVTDWLQTGDVAGLVDGELVVVGRQANVVCVGGRNLHAHDVEAVAEEVPGVRAGGAVAIADRGQTEGLAIGVRTLPDRDCAPVLWAVREAVSAAFGVEPSQVFPLARIPRTTSGKKQRAALRAQLEAGDFDESVGNTLAAVQQELERVLGREVSAEALDGDLRELGATSLQAVDLLARLSERLGAEPDHRRLVRAPSLRALARGLEREPPVRRRVGGIAGHEALAIAAATCRVPGADSASELWRIASEGAVQIRPSDRWDSARVGGFVSGVDRFDAGRFGISADEASAMDPQQRLVLTLAADAIEQAGLGEERSVGVFVGAGQQSYLHEVLDRLDDGLPAGTMAGNLLNMIAARVAHQLDLRGPALCVDTACSSGLVALHLARRSLEAGECEAAVVAAVNLNLNEAGHRLFEAAGALSPTGRCLPFSDEADGMVPGEGAVVLVLVRASQANEPLGHLLGSAINNDGASLGVMAPNPAGQDAVIRAALADAGVQAEAVTYVEAHGTGTPVGDAVEASVLARCYPHEPRTASVKAQLGHLLAAAGLAGLLRALGELEPDEVGAVSSFGFGGTNAHALIRRGTGSPGRSPFEGTRHWLGELPVEGWLHTVRKDPGGGLQWRPLAPGPGVVAGGRFLITGASGALGRHLARHLARRADELVLLGRRPLDSELRSFLRDLRRLGSAVSWRSVDFLDEQALDEQAATLGRFDAAFHLAGVLGPEAHAVKCSSLERLASLEVGAWVLFSSIAGVLPGLQAGVEDYARANAWLDSWAEANDRRDRPVVSIAWPPWVGAGLAAGLAEAYAARGIQPIEARRALAALDAAMGAGAPRVVVLRRSSDRAVALAPQAGDAVRARLALAADRGMDELQDDDALTELGVDSVAALELVSDLEAIVGRDLPTTLLFEHRTVGSLLAALAGGVERIAPVEAEAAQDAVPLLPSQDTFVAQARYFPDVPGNVLLGCSVGDGAIDRGRLESALATLVERHPVLASRVDGRSLRFDGAPPSLHWHEQVDVEAAHQQPFDLERGPVLHLHCDGTTLVLHAAHAAVDAWSAAIALQDLLRLHEGQELPPLPSTWADAAAALRASGDGDTAWWARTLAGAPPLALGLRAPDEQPASGPFRLQRWSLDRDASAALIERARSAQVTLPVLVLAAWMHGLERWSGQHDLVVRVAQGRREARIAGIERLVGSFADSLPLRVVLQPGESFDAFARRVGERLAEVQARAGSSARALAALGTRSGGPKGLSPAGFSFPRLASDPQIGALRLRDVVGASASGFTRLGLIAWEFAGRLEATWNFAESHLDAAQVAGWAADFEAILRRLGAGEQAEPPSEETLHGAILAELRRHPERVAIEGVTCGQLDRRSAALARRLPASERIAVFARPGPDAVVAVLAIMRSGAAYVPIDPDWPAARQAQVLAKAEVAAVVLARGLDVTVPASLPTFRVNEDEAASGPERAGHLAYIMFTSGSTGEPKGVCVPHSANLLFQRWVRRVFGVTEADRFVQTSSLAFGGSIRQMFTPLLFGASIHPVPRSIARDPDALIDFIRSERITIWNSVPSLWTRLMDALERTGLADPLPSVRWVLVGGEAVAADHARRWWQLYGGRYRLANLYGSTESIVNATWFEVLGEPPPEAVHLPIGWARSGVDTELVDGELWVGGAVAEGYLFAPEATREAFVQKDGRRLYRTGDLVHQEDDGALVYLGRIDSQVQVRGNRVEPKEIEHHLCAEPGVEHALVVQEPDGRLFAAFEGTASPTALRSALAGRLPGYMVPHRIEALDRLPRTPAGKLDRRGLSAARAEAEAPQPAPPHLDALRRAWAEVLGLRELPDPDADFFECGGDSLLLLDVLDHLRATLPLVPSPRVLYAEPTLRGMASALELVEAEAPAAKTALSAVERGFVATGRSGTQPVWTALLPVSGPLDRRALEQAVAWIVRRHEALRSVFPSLDERRVVPSLELALQFDDLEPLPPELHGKALDARWEEERHARFDLATGPLVRVRLVRLAPTEHRLMLSAHHVVADAWSAWLLAGEVLAAHDAFAAGRTPDLPTAPQLRPRDIPRADPWWTQRLAGLEQRPARGGEQRARLTISPARWMQLVDAGRARGLPPFALVLGAFGRALAAEFATDDLAVATALSGRDGVDGARAAVGSWARAVPIRLGPKLGDEQALAAFAEARLHSNASPASIAAAGDLRALGRWFLTWLDPAAVLPEQGGALTPDWAAGRYRFETRSTDTEVLLAAMPLDGLRLSLEGGPVVHALARRLEQELGGPDAALIVYAPEGMAVPLKEAAIIESVQGAGVNSELVLLPTLAGIADGRLDALDRAVRHSSARVVALAGMLPAWSGLGTRPLGRPDQLVTTGHAATVVAMVLTIEAALKRLGRSWTNEDVAVVGWGSIGRAVAALAQARFGEPARLRRVDPALPEGDGLGEATLILGASSGGRSLDVDALAPGTVVIDDSFPRLFDDAAAWGRMRSAGDVLLVGGGCLDVGPLARTSPFPQADAVRAQFPSRWLPGCHAEAVLLALRPELGATRGPVHVDRARAVLDAVLRLGWSAAPLHLGPDEVPVMAPTTGSPA